MNSKTLIFLLYFSLLSNFTYCQDKTYLDFINEMTPTFPGCENSTNKSECYKLEVSKVILTEINKPENLTELNNYNGIFEIEIMLRNEIDGKTNILRIEKIDEKLKNIVRKSLENLPLIQPISSFREGKPSVSSTGFLVVLEKKTNSKEFEIVNRKPNQDFSKIPSPSPDKIKHVVLQGCEEEKKTNSDCFNQKIKQLIIDNIDNQTLNKIKGERFTLKIKIDKNGKLDKNSFDCSLKNYNEYFFKLLESLKIVQPAELNGERIDLTYSIPFKIS